MRNINQGFSLLELLFVMVIMGIITSFAIPEFKAYRARAYDLRAQQDARNIALAEEAYYLDNEEYLSCENSECRALPGIKALSQGVTITAEALNDDDAFTVKSKHPKGSGKEFIWDSREGGFQ